MQSLKLRWKDITGNPTGRIMLCILLFFIIIGSTFLVYTYYSQINAYKHAELGKLQAISTSLAIELNGDEHRMMWVSFPEMDAINGTGQSTFYDETNAILHRSKMANRLNTDIYTIVFDSSEAVFKFATTSATSPYFRHIWKDFDAAHLSAYSTGSTLGPYKDDYGTWLSSFSPVRASDGTTVALLQVDEPFDSFIAEAKQKILWQLIAMIGLLIVMISGMLIIIQGLLRKEDRVKRIMNMQRKEIEMKNAELLSSIDRAKTIQDALLPELEKIRQFFPEMFVMFEPRDVVSGDFFWFATKGDEAFFAVADCTGHGVPGAFMSMIGHSLLNDILTDTVNHTPATILNELDCRLSKMLNDNASANTDGMDIALIKYSRYNKKLEFAGAMRPLIKISNGDIYKFSGDKSCIGGHLFNEKHFTNSVIDVLPGDSIYLFSDGYVDQFGGRFGKKYMSKNFSAFLSFVQEHFMEDQQYLLQYEFHHWKNNEDQIDDVLVAGLKIPSAA